MGRIDLEDASVREHVVVLRGERDDVFDVVLFGKVGNEFDLVVLHGPDDEIDVRKRRTCQDFFDMFRSISRIKHRQIQRISLAS